MKKILKFRRGISILTALVLVVSSMFVFVSTTQGAALSALSDTMSSNKVSTASSHVIRFTTPTGASDLTDTIIITFPSGFNFTSKVATSTVFTHGASTGLENTETFAATPSATVWGAVFSGASSTVLTLTAPTDGVGIAAVAANDKVIITYDSTNSTNASTSGSKTITIAGAFGDTGSIAIGLVTDNQVAVSATVDPSMTFSLSATSVNLGTLSASAVSTGSIIATSSTNSISGFSTTVLYDHKLRIDGSNDINDVGDGAVTAGSEEYGIATSDSAQTISQDTDCSNSPYTASAITASAQSVAGATSGPVTEADTICLAASITSTTVAGGYSHTLTFISTATF